MGSFDMLFLGIPLLAAFVITAGSAYQGFKLRSWLFVIPVILGVWSLLSAVGLIIGGPDSTSMGCLSTGFGLFLSAIVYFIVKRRVVSAGQQPPAPPASSNPPNNG